jgi:hypothetical protein
MRSRAGASLLANDAAWAADAPGYQLKLIVRQFDGRKHRFAYEFSILPKRGSSLIKARERPELAANDESGFSRLPRQCH